MRNFLNIIKRSAPITSALICLLLCAPSATAGSMADFAPEETLAYLQARDLTRLREVGKTTPFYQIWAGSKFEAFLKPLKGKVSEKLTIAQKEGGVSFDAILKHFPGEAAIFLSEMQGGKGSAGGTNYFSIGFMARITKEDKKEIETLIEEKIIGEDLPANAERSVDKFKDVQIHSTIYREESKSAEVSERTGKSMAREMCYEYAFVDDLLVLNVTYCFSSLAVMKNPVAFTKKSLSNYFEVKESKKATRSLAATANWQQATRLLDGKKALAPQDSESDLNFYINIERLVDTLFEDIDEEDLKRVLVSLGLKEMKSLLLSAYLLQNGLELDVAFPTTPSPKGLSSLLINDLNNKFRGKRLAPANSVAFSSAAFDFGQLYQLIKTVMNQAGENVSQGVAAFETQIQQATDVRLYEDIFQPLRGEISGFSYPSNTSATPGELQTGNNTVFLFEVTREQDYGMKLAKLVGFALQAVATQMKVEAVPFQGFDIYTVAEAASAGDASGAISPGQDTALPAFAIADSFLIIGSNIEEVKETLRRVKSGGDNITKSEKFNKMTSVFEPGYRWVDWTNVSQGVEEVVKMLQSTPPLLFVLAPYVDISNMPSPEEFGRHFGDAGSALYINRDSLRHKTVLTWPEATSAAR